MLATLRDISDKVATQEEEKSADLSESTPEPTSADVVLGASTIPEVTPSIPETASEDTPSELSEASEAGRSARSLRLDGSISENGMETDDEGMVHVRRPVD
jgi:lysophosphatidate acyltransferase